MANSNSIKTHRKKRIKGKESLIKVAAIQMEPRIGDKAYNVKKQLKLIGDASRKGAILIVLPELGSTGYIFNRRGEVAELAEEVPDGPTCLAWMKACQQRGIYLCGGIVERDGEKFYNSAVLVGPKGFIAWTRYQNGSVSPDNPLSRFGSLTDYKKSQNDLIPRSDTLFRVPFSLTDMADPSMTGLPPCQRSGVLLLSRERLQGRSPKRGPMRPRQIPRRTFS